MKNRKSDLLCAAFLLLIALCYAAPSLAPGRAFGPYDLLWRQYPWGASIRADGPPSNPEQQDFVHQFHPWRTFYAETLKKGEVPLWNPHQMCGMPFAANDQAAVFYPPNLLYLAMPISKAFGASAALHLFLAGLFMFLFLRLLGAGRAGALASGSAYMFTGWMVVWMTHASKFDAAAWAPLVFLFFELSLRKPALRWKLLCGVTLGMQLTAGFLQISAYTAYALAIYAAARWLLSRKDQINRVPLARAAASLATAAGVSIALSAIHLFQVLALTAQSQRSHTPGDWRFFKQGIPPQMLITALLPDFFGNPSDPRTPNQLDYTEMCCYAGAAALCLALIALFRIKKTPPRQAAVIGSLAAVAVVGIACAPGTFLYSPFFYLAPGGKFLAVNRIIFLYMFGVSAIAGFAVGPMIKGLAAKDALKSAAWLTVFAAAGAAAVFQLNPAPPPAPPEILRDSALLFLASVAAVALFGLLAPAFAKINGNLTAAIAALIVLSDLFRWGVGFNPVAESFTAFYPTVSIDMLRSLSAADGMRVHAYTYDEQRRRSAGLTLFPNTATAYGLDDIRGYDSLYPKRYQDFIAALQESASTLKLPRQTVVNTSVITSKWIDFMGVKYLIASAGLPANSGYDFIYQPEHDLPLYANTHVLPRAMTLCSWIVTHSKADELKLMMGPDLSPSFTAALENNPPGLGAPCDGPNRSLGKPAHIYNRTANTVNIDAEGDGLLVLSDAWADGWTATVDGIHAPIMRANYTFRAVPLPGPGGHTVAMKYYPRSARLGLRCSLATLAVSFLALTIIFRRKQHV